MILRSLWKHTAFCACSNSDSTQVNVLLSCMCCQGGRGGWACKASGGTRAWVQVCGEAVSCQSEQGGWFRPLKAIPYGCELQEKSTMKQLSLKCWFPAMLGLSKDLSKLRTRITCLCNLAQLQEAIQPLPLHKCCRVSANDMRHDPVNRSNDILVELSGNLE